METFRTALLDGSSVVEFPTIPGRRYSLLVGGEFGGGTVTIADLIEIYSETVGVILDTITSTKAINFIAAGNVCSVGLSGATNPRVVAVLTLCPLGA